MSLSKSIYELTVVAGSVGKVLEGSSKIIQNDVFQWYQNGFVPKTIRDSCDSYIGLDESHESRIVFGTNPF